MRKLRTSFNRGTGLQRAWLMLLLILPLGVPRIGLAAQSANWTPELIKTGQGRRGPRDPIAVRITAPAETIQYLALELDGFDVSQIVSFENSVASFTPPQDLSYGVHKLRLLEYQPDGTTIEHGAWSLDIRQSEAFRDAQVDGKLWLDASERLADRDLTQPEPKRFNLGGGTQINGKLEADTWQFTGSSDLIYNNNRDLMPRGANAGSTDLGAFLLTASDGPLVAQAGHFNASPVDNLVMQGFSRRGISVGMNWSDKQNSLIAFSQHTQPVTGFQGGLGIGDANNRSDGVVLSSHPLAQNRDALLINAVYVNGAGAEQTGTTGSGVIGETTHTNGNAADVLADSNFLDRRLRLRGEYAISDFDFDGNGIDINNDGIIDYNQPSIHDHAYSGLVSYTPWQNKTLGGKPVSWDVGLEKKRVGSYFRSPTNPAGIADQSAIHGFTDLNWSGLYLYASLGSTTDNVDGDSLRPRIKSTDTNFTTTYTPIPAINTEQGAGPPATPWYGQPSFILAMTKVDQDVVNSGGGYLVGAFNSTTSMSLSAGFSYPGWNWLVSHIISKNDNKTGQAVDTRNVVTQLALNTNISNFLNFSTNLQYSTLEESNPPPGITARDTDTWTAGLSVGYMFTTNINALLQFNYNDSQTSDHSFDNTSRDLIASLSWAMSQSRGLKPGTTLLLEGQTHNVSGSATGILNQDSYQVFLKVSLNWMPHY